MYARIMIYKLLESPFKNLSIGIFLKKTEKQLAEKTRKCNEKISLQI